MKLDEKSLTILERFGLEYVNPHEIYQKYFDQNGISRATFYRRLEILKQAELIEWRVGKVRLTQKGLSLIKLANSEESFQIDERADSDQDHVVHLSNSGRDDGTQKGLKHPFRVYEASKLKDKIDDSLFMLITLKRALFSKYS
jgi:Fe2+ or Zn2+ uptake regulation protein